MSRKTRVARFRRLLAPVLAAIALPLVYAPARAEGPVPSPACAVPENLTRLARPLNRFAQRLAAGGPILIIAVGSSSTAGAGASSPAASYPSRLAAELREWFPHHAITVLNRGVNGEETRDMLARFETGVLVDKPDLVLWQVGTNAVLRDRPLANAGALIGEGLRKLRPIGADVILIDPQYAPKVIAKPEAEAMISVIAAVAKQNNINLFGRYGVMRHWRKVAGMPFGVFLSPDELHMNDWGYGCIAKLLAAAIADAAMRPTQTATSSPARQTGLKRP